MKFDNNIITKMKNTSKFKNINNEDLLVKEFDLAIARAFAEIKDTNDLLALINSVNKVIYKKSKSIKIQYLLYHAYHNHNRYIHFYISKKSGGQRTISAPTKALKNIQTTLNYILSCVYKPQMPVHGFLKNRSVVTNAKHHTEKNYVYNIDLKNFFPSIHKARIEKRLQLPPFNLSDERSDVATIISRLTTQKVIEYTDSLTGKKELLLLDNKKLIELPGNKKILENIKNSNDDSYRAFAVLPQGAPTSPIVSNLICDRLDRRLMGLAKRFKLKYTRYADDITFSSMHNVYQDDSEFILEMKKIITDQSFEINPKKTRLQKRGYRQEVTGVIVNDKTNVNKRYIKQLRAMLYSIEKFGIEKAQKDFVKHYNTDRSYVKNNIPDMINVIHGKLEYLKMVKGSKDSIYEKLKKRFDVILNPKDESEELTDADVELCKKALCKEGGKSTQKHNPKELVKILRNFTTCNNNPCALKASVHSEEVYYEFDGYLDFMNNLEFAWNDINVSLKKLSKRLHGKTYAFLFAKDLGTEERKKKFKGKDGWGENGIRVGWSSLELKKWCLDTHKNPKGNNPFEYELEDKDKIKVNGKTISTFFDICMNVFKHEIEVRSEIDQLYNIFEEIQESVGSKFCINIDERLRGQDFYTDVHWLKSGINTIFSEIKKRQEHNIIDIKLKESNNNFFEVEITQNDSYSNKESKKLASEINDGDFQTVSEKLCSLCDWSIETNCSDGNFRINFLRDKDVEVMKKLDYKPKGFIHILRFYK